MKSRKKPLRVRYTTLYSSVPRYLCRKANIRRGIAEVALNVAIFGLLPWLVTLYGMTSTFIFDAMPRELVIGMYISSVWIFLGPALIWWWETRYYDFILKIVRYPKSAPRNTKRLFELSAYHSKYARIHGFTWAAITIFFFIMSIPYIKQYTTFIDNIPLFSITTIILIYSGYACGYGVSGVFQTLILFFNINRFDLRWYPFHHDSRGGFGFLANFSLVTTIAFSGGSVVIPATLGVAKLGGSLSVEWIYVIVIVYTILIAMVFTYPVYKIYSMAAEMKEREVKILALKMEALYDRLGNPLDLFESRFERVASRIEMLCSIERRIASASDIPFSPAIALAAASTIAAPAASALFQVIGEFLFKLI